MHNIDEKKCDCGKVKSGAAEHYKWCETLKPDIAKHIYVWEDPLNISLDKLKISPSKVLPLSIYDEEEKL